MCIIYIIQCLEKLLQKEKARKIKPRFAELNIALKEFNRSLGDKS